MVAQSSKVDLTESNSEYIVLSNVGSNFIYMKLGIMVKFRANFLKKRWQKIYWYY